MMASSWTATPEARPLSDAESSELRPSLPAQNFNSLMASSHSPKLDAKECTGPFAVSAAQISFKIREVGPPASLPSEVVLDEQPILSALPIAGLQVDDGSPSDAHTNVFTTTRQARSSTSFFVKREPRPTSVLQTAPQSSMFPRPGLTDIPNNLTFDAKPSAQTMATFDGVDIETSHLVRSPLPKCQQVARPQPSLSTSTFEPQVLALAPTTHSQPIAPISTVPNSPPMGPSPLPTFNQSPTQSPDLERRRPQRPATMRSSTLKTVGTGRSMLSMAQSHSSQYTEMIIESVDSVSFWYTALSCFLHWVILAGFLVLPTTFDDLQEITVSSSAFNKALHTVRHVPFLVVGFTCSGIGALGLCVLWWRWSHNYIWLLTSIFIPGIFSGLSGLISTFVNLYGPQVSFNSSQIAFNGSQFINGTQNTCDNSQNSFNSSQNACNGPQNGVHYGGTTIATIAACGGCSVICTFLTAIYSIRKRLVKRRHDREVGQQRSDNGGEFEAKP